MANDERIEVFKFDLAKLRSWNARSVLDRSALLEASNLISRWLLDRHPLLQDLCDTLGVQLLLPGATKRRKAYQEQVMQMQPYFYLFAVDPDCSRLGADWVQLSVFKEDLFFAISGKRVSLENFVKLVRNKFGGTHFDESAREKWQRELAKFTKSLKIGGQDTLNLAMKYLIKAVLMAVERSDVEKRCLGVL